MSKPKTITLDGVEYIEKDSVKQPSVDLDGMKFVIVRTYSAGCFAGYLAKREGKEGTLKKAIRLWFWDGAASLSQLAQEGVKKPENCKFAMPVDSIDLTEIIEVIDTTKQAQDNITSVPSWKK